MEVSSLNDNKDKSLLMDYYQLTMSRAHYNNGTHEDIAYFDMFFRSIPDNGGYAVFNGLDKVIEYVQNFKFSESDIQLLSDKGDFDEDFLRYLSDFKFTGDIWAVPDGTVVFPREPLITVRGNKIEAQLLETKLLLIINYASLISTKAARIVNAAQGRSVLEFGARRAQGESASIEGAKYAYIAGCDGTANIQAEKEYGIPSSGTMAHSYIEAFDNEYDAFLSYAKAYPESSIFLIDTYDTLYSGILNAIKVAKNYLEPNGYRLKGVRLDSGDLAWLSKEVRKILNENGMDDCKIIASNSLDEFTIKSLIEQGAKIDVFGVGERLITSKSNPVFGGVYKLVAIERDNEIVPRIKLSENEAKVTTPGFKKSYRFYDQETGYALGDVIALADEVIPDDKYVLVNDALPWQQTTLTNYNVRELQVPVFKDGELVYDMPSIEERRAYCKRELATLYPEVRRFDNPHGYYANLSSELARMKYDLILSQKQAINKNKGNGRVFARKVDYES